MRAAEIRIRIIRFSRQCFVVIANRRVVVLHVEVRHGAVEITFQPLRFQTDGFVVVLHRGFMITHGVVDIAAVAISRCIIGFQTEDCGVGSNSVFSSACCGHDVADVAKGINGNLLLSPLWNRFKGTVFREEFFNFRVVLDFLREFFLYREMLFLVTYHERPDTCHRPC